MNPTEFKQLCDALNNIADAIRSASATPSPTPKKQTQSQPQRPQTDEIVIFGLNDVLTFGKHRGATVRQVLAEDPDYLDWVEENVDWCSLCLDQPNKTPQKSPKKTVVKKTAVKQQPKSKALSNPVIPDDPAVYF